MPGNFNHQGEISCQLRIIIDQESFERFKMHSDCSYLEITVQIMQKQLYNHLSLMISLYPLNIKTVFKNYQKR